MKTPEEYLNECLIGVNKEKLESHFHFKKSVIEAMRRYAEDACKEQREICAENARYMRIINNISINKSSILNAPSPIKP